MTETEPTETRVTTPAVGNEAAWVGAHLRHVVGDEVRASGRFRGTQAAADAALAGVDLHGYARRRSEVLPASRRGASALSPYVRHGLLTLPTVWEAAAAAPEGDRRKFRDELLWQEYARHVYARVGQRNRTGLRFEPVTEASVDGPWDRSMACIDVNLTELERDGWLVNQTRMWLASQWTVRHGADWRTGEDRFFAHLLDGSRAANRLGWQWTVGAGTGKQYGFSRWQVTKRAPGLCDRCPRRHDCPIEDWPDDRTLAHAAPEPLLRSDPDPARTAGPLDADGSGVVPDTVWITAESLGAADPALLARPDLPVVFVFDEPLLARLRLSSKRLVFLAERLAELAHDRTVEVHIGVPERVLADRSIATTFAPVPGWRRVAGRIDVVEVHPWPWLRRPADGPIGSFSAWRRSVERRADRRTHRRADEGLHP